MMIVIYDNEMLRSAQFDIGCFLGVYSVPFFLLLFHSYYTVFFVIFFRFFLLFAY